jgi:hypothetical protein
VHRLVAEAFLGKGKKCEQVNHKNGVKTDNHVNNLEWCTGKENVRHAYRLGLRSARRGESSNWAKLDEVSVRAIKTLCAWGVLQDVVAEMFEVNQSAVSMIALGKRWGHLTGDIGEADPT